MDQKKIDRINALARKAKSGQTLSEEELTERDALRREYIDSVKSSLVDHLDHTYIQRPGQEPEKLKRKDRV